MQFRCVWTPMSYFVLSHSSHLHSRLLKLSKSRAITHHAPLPFLDGCGPNYENPIKLRLPLPFSKGMWAASFALDEGIAEVETRRGSQEMGMPKKYGTKIDYDFHSASLSSTPLSFPPLTTSMPNVSVTNDSTTNM